MKRPSFWAPNALLAGAILALAAAGPALAQSDPERVQRLENSVRSLTGQVEELSFQVRQLQQQLQAMQRDNEFRFGELEGGAAPAQRQAAQPQPQPQPDAIGDLSQQPLTDGDLQLGAPAQDLGTLTMDAPPAADQPLDLSSLGNGGTGDGDGLVDLAQPAAAQAEVAAVQLTGDARTDYDQAYAMIRAGRYDLAESAFRQFLGSYAGSELAPEAQYWLGESLFARGEYGRAAEEFRAGYKAYPKSRRGPDTLLKLGLSMAGLGYRDEACQMYAATLKQYPQMSNGLRQRVVNEQASAGC